MSWSGSGTIRTVNGDTQVNISASPQSNNDVARQKSMTQIDAAKSAAKTLAEGGQFGDGEFNVSISGHAHSEGDSNDCCSISLNHK